VRGADYTRALLRACQNIGNVTWIKMRVVSQTTCSMLVRHDRCGDVVTKGGWSEQESIEAVSNMGFDTVVVAAGAACADIKELKDTVPLKRVRGQVCCFA
jgi:hypothetical protein